MKITFSLAIVALIVITTSGCGKKLEKEASAAGNPSTKAEGDASQMHDWFKGEWTVIYERDSALGVVIGSDDSVKINLSDYKADGTGRYDAKKGAYTTQIAPGKGGIPGKTLYKGTPEDFYIELRFASNTTPGEAPTHLNYKIQSIKFNATAQEGTLMRKTTERGKL